MKQIIIFLLLIIASIMGYNVYSTYQRFSLDNYRYTVLDSINVTNTNKSDILNYHRAVETLNGFVITQWSANAIDVRHPEDNDAVTKAAVAQYANKLANVKYFETLLQNPMQPRPKLSAKEKRNTLLKQLLMQPKSLQYGKSSAAVYELQKLLKARGFDIPVDGYYRIKTLNALKAFKAQHRLFSDGTMDVLTLEALFTQ